MEVLLEAVFVIRSEAISCDLPSSVQFHSAKGRNFNNMLYVRYVHLTKKPSIFIKVKPIFSSERMLRKDYDRKSSVEKETLFMSLKVLGAKTN
jgi:hypothetical protein